MKQFLLTLGLALVSLASHAQFTRTYNGVLTANDPTIPGDRLLRDGVAGACGTTKTYPSTSSGAGVHYNQYTVTNSTAASACLTIALTHNCSEATTPLIFGSVYSGSFVPANLATNYKSDQGTSPGITTAGGSNTITSSVTVNAKETIVVVVSGLSAANTCSSYTLTLSSPTALPVRAVQGVDARALTAYPNPVADVLYIEAAKGSYTLFNATGQAVRHIKSSDASVADLPSGVYMLQQDETKVTTKVVKL